jgi:hypothetical protein
MSNPGLLLGQNFCYCWPLFLRFGIPKRKHERNVEIFITNKSIFCSHSQVLLAMASGSPEIYSERRKSDFFHSLCWVLWFVQNCNKNHRGVRWGEVLHFAPTVISLVAGDCSGRSGFKIWSSCTWTLHSWIADCTVDCRRDGREAHVLVSLIRTKCYSFRSAFWQIMHWFNHWNMPQMTPSTI